VPTTTGVTGAQEHLYLVMRFDRPRLFDRLLAAKIRLQSPRQHTVPRCRALRAPVR
jgi:hypothetical protein